MNDVISRSRSKRTKKRSKAARAKRFKLPLTALCIGTALWAITVLLIFLGRPVSYIELAVGQTASTTVAASVPFEFVDTARTEANRARARDAIAPVYTLDGSSLDIALNNLNDLFNELEKTHESLANVEPLRTTSPTTNTTESVTPESGPETDAFAALDELLTAQRIELSASNLVAHIPSHHIQDVRKFLTTEFKRLLGTGIIEPPESDIALQRTPGAKPQIVPQSQLTDPAKLADAISASFIASRQNAEVDETIIPPIVAPYANRNLIFNQTLTRELREKAAADIPDEIVQIAANQTLVSAGDTATADIINRLEAHKRTLGLQANPFLRLFATACILLAALFITAGLLLIVLPKSFQKPRRLLLGTLLALIPIFIAKGLVILNEAFPFAPDSIVILLIPVALAPLMATLLVNSRFGMAVGLWTSFAVAVLADNSFTIFCLGLLVTVVATVSVKNLHRRSGMLNAGLFLGLAQAIFVTGATALDVRDVGALWPPFLASFGTGLVTAFLATLLLPLFEWAFRTTSPVRLLELGDMQHPLIQRLMLEAPGTYHHSLMVATLSKSAAVEIGADDLLVHVAALYHDIGKLTKPEFFIENSGGHNPHDDMTPSMSRMVILAHVKEGITMAQNHKLPQVIIDGIRTHHGNQVVSYFYHRAREQAAEDGLDPDTISADDFRYPGPLPETPELGILLLADTVEAASRSLDNPTPKNIETLVDRLVADKLADGQLDNCNLTFAQLTTIKKAFVFCLTTSLHSRIAYPKDDEHRTQQPSQNHPDQRDADPPIPSLAHTPSP